MKTYLFPFLMLTGTVIFSLLYIRGVGPGEHLDIISKQKGSVRYSQLQQLRRETAIKVELESKTAEMNKKVNKPDLDPGFLERNSFHKTEMNFNPPANAKDLEDEGASEALTLDQRMDAFLAKKQWYEQQEASKKKAYVEKFVHEAYKMGFEVQVDDQFQITSVRKITPQ